jgi:hypothetical protein
MLVYGADLTQKIGVHRGLVLNFDQLRRNSYSTFRFKVAFKAPRNVGARRKWKTRPERYDKKVHHIGARRRVHPVLSGIDWPWNYQFGHIETGDTGVRWGQWSEFGKMVHVLFGVCSVSDSLSAYVGEEYIPRAVCHPEWICIIHIT